MKSIPHENKSTEAFPALTGLRAICAFMVFFSHLQLLLSPAVLVAIQKNMRVGVNIFFVLSGFLITYRYYNKVELSRNWLKAYFVRRFARIYPVYFLLVTAVIVSRGNFDISYMLTNYTLTHAAVIGTLQVKDLAIFPSWSLTVEECFYLVAPLIFLFTRKYTLLLPFIVSAIICVAVFFIYRDNNRSLGTNMYGVSFSFWSNFFAFYAGIFLGLQVLKKETMMPIAKRYKWTLAGCLSFIVVMIPSVYTSIENPLYHMLIRTTSRQYLLPVSCVILMYGLMTERSVLHRFLSTRVMRLLGKSSYAFYLLHVPVIFSIGKYYLLSKFPAEWYNLYVLTMFILCIAGSVVLYLYFEEPVNRWLVNRYGRKPRHDLPDVVSSDT